MKELSKKELELAGIQAAEHIIETGESALDRTIEISRQIALLEAEKKTLKEYAFDERALHGSDVLEIQGCKISISNTGDRLQYNEDPIIAEHNKAIEERKKDVKTAVKSTGVYFDADGVEVEKVPVKYGSEVIKISF
jgi:hypothetical protein